MKYISLNNGIKMPIIGYGTWTLKGKDCERAVIDALEVGYRLIDTAQMYKNEKEVGNAIKKTKILREEIFITTKICSPNTTYLKTKEAINKSLKELQLEYIDLMLIHKPYENSLKMYKAMEEAYKEGKIKAIGISNFNISEYNSFIKNCEIIPAINQVEAHIFFRKKDLQETMEKHKTKMEAWSPLVAGKEKIFENKILIDIGKKHNKTSAQVALKYLVQNDIIIIPKTSNKERMKENIDILDFELSDAEMTKISRLDKNKSLFGWQPKIYY